MKNKKLDPYTFGGSKASENLVDILQKKYPQLIHRVGKIYSSFCGTMASLRASKDNFSNNSCGGSVSKLMLLYRNHIFECVKESKFPPEVESHLLNVIAVIYKKHINYLHTMNNTDTADLLIHIDEDKIFRCECGCNVFRHVFRSKNKYKCNSCGAIYTG